MPLTPFFNNSILINALRKKVERGNQRVKEYILPFQQQSMHLWIQHLFAPC